MNVSNKRGKSVCQNIGQELEIIIDQRNWPVIPNLSRTIDRFRYHWDVDGVQISVQSLACSKGIEESIKMGG